MNKRFKIVSSLALAGLLSINVLSPRTFAATVNDKIDTNPVGIYRKLVEGKEAVPYVLVGSEDAVTVKEVLNSKEFVNVTKFNGTSIPNENTLVSTGDTFVADGTEYTIVIYGDVNKDGKVNSSDALLVQEYSAEMTSLDAIQMEAADVVNDGKVNSNDARRIKEFAAELEASPIDKVPDTEKQEVVSKYKVDINDNGKINKQNASKTDLKLKIDKTLNKEETFTVKLIGADGKETVIAKDISGNTLKMPAHTDLIEVKIDVSSIPDGKIAGTVIEENKTETKFVTEKSTVEPNATNVKTNRVNTKTATLSLNSCGDSDVVKVYYEVVKHNDTQPEKIENVITVSNNSVKDETVATDLDTDTAYDVWYVLEDSFGTKSEPQKSTITTDSSAVKKIKNIKKINVPDLTKVNSAEFTWDAELGITYVATLYKDGKAIANKKVDEGKVTFVEKMKDEGTYKLEVYGEGTDMLKASDSTTSEEVKVEKLPAVTDLKFSNEEGKIFLNWKNSNKEKEFASYKIELVEIDKDGKESNPINIDTSNLKTSENKIDLTKKIADNTIYKGKVTIIANGGQKAKIDSEETVSEQFYKVGQPNIDGAEISEHSITLLSDGININGKKATYKVKVFDVNTKATLEEPYYSLKTTKPVEIKDGKIVIDGLNSNTLYAFKLIATIDGVESESDYTLPESTLPELKNLTIVGTEKEAKTEGNVYVVNEDTIVLNGNTIDSSNYYSEKLDNSLAMINSLKVGDKVSIENNKIDVKLDGGASANVSERDFTDVDLTETVLNVESNDFSKTLKINNVKELSLEGTGSIFNLDNVTSKKIVLTNGVEVTSSKVQEYKVNAGTTVTMNQIKMTTSKDTNVKVNGNVLTVESNTEANDLVFENKKDREITIVFEGKDDNTSAQSGSITIKENAKVTIISNKVNVNADLKVEVNNGDIDLTEPSLTGDKTVTVAKDAQTKIKAVAETKAPIYLYNFEMKEYTDEELKKSFGENATKVKEYIASFGINGKGAKITVSKDSKDVTITFEKATASATIKNIK